MLYIIKMYTGESNDINQASYKLAKTALKNTPSQNPKEFATTAEREAKANEGKVSSIINLVDEIDTTIYVINDKILNNEFRGYNGGFEGGGKQKKEVSSIYKVPNKFLMKEVRDRGIKSKSRKKDDLVRYLDPVKDEVIANFNESLRETQGADEQDDVVSVDGSVVSTSSEDERSRLSDAVQDASNTSQFIQGLLNNSGGDGGYDSSSDDESGYTGSRNPYDSDESDDTGSSGISDDNSDDTSSSGISSNINNMIRIYKNDDNDETNSSSSTNDKIIQINTIPDSGGDGYFIGATNAIGDLVKSNLNSNIMKLEEQIIRLSRLTKGINKFINYSSSI